MSAAAIVELRRGRRAGSIPTSFVLDPQGVIRHRIDGQVHYPRLEKLVLPLIPD